MADDSFLSSKLDALFSFVEKMPLNFQKNAYNEFCERLRSRIFLFRDSIRELFNFLELSKENLKNDASVFYEKLQEKIQGLDAKRLALVENLNIEKSLQKASLQEEGEIVKFFQNEVSMRKNGLSEEENQAVLVKKNKNEPFSPPANSHLFWFNHAVLGSKSLKEILRKMVVPIKSYFRKQLGWSSSVYLQKTRQFSANFEELVEYIRIHKRFPEEELDLILQVKPFVGLQGKEEVVYRHLATIFNKQNLVNYDYLNSVYQNYIEKYKYLEDQENVAKIKKIQRFFEAELEFIKKYLVRPSIALKFNKTSEAIFNYLDQLSSK